VIEFDSTPKYIYFLYEQNV